MQRAAARARSRRPTFAARTGPSTCPALIAEPVRHLALGGPPADRPGRRVCARTSEPLAPTVRARRAPRAAPTAQRAAGRQARRFARPARARRRDVAACRADALYSSVGPEAPSGAGPHRSPSAGSPFGEARRSLKTQQHAHLRSASRSWCASRFDPPASARIGVARRRSKSQVEKYPVMVRDHGV